MSPAPNGQRVERWDNPVKMFCQGTDQYGSGMADHTGQLHGSCHADAIWVTVEGETVTGFYCHYHHLTEILFGKGACGEVTR